MTDDYRNGYQAGALAAINGIMHKLPEADRTILEHWLAWRLEPWARSNPNNLVPPTFPILGPDC